MPALFTCWEVSARWELVACEKEEDHAPPCMEADVGIERGAGAGENEEDHAPPSIETAGYA